MGASTSVLVDARALQVSGIGRYLRETLSTIAADRRFGRIVLLGREAELREYAAGAPEPARFELRSYPHGFYSARAQLAWLRLRAEGATQADVTFFPHYDVPLLGFPSRSVVTIHDLTHFKVPDAFAAWQRLGASLLLRRASASASRIICVSEATQRDLIARTPALASRTVVISNGVSATFRPLAPGEASGGSGPVPDAPYLLCVGNRKPHKNLGAAVEALALLTSERPELSLVVVGRVFPGWDEVMRRAEALGVRERIVDLPSVSDAELRDLYRGCEALVFPSLYEGFGLPVLEAMACGAPVIASRRASLPEVVGDAGLLFDPERPDEIAEAVRRLAAQPELRERLTRLGQERAARFTWERTGRETADLLFRAATGQAPEQPHAALPA